MKWPAVWQMARRGGVSLQTQLFVCVDLWANEKRAAAAAAITKGVNDA